MTSDHLEEGLARMARREEMQRRLGGGTPTPPRWPPDASGMAASTGPLPTVDEVAAAVGRVVERHPAASVTLTVRDADGAWVVQVGWRDGSVRTSTMPLAASPVENSAATPPDGQPAAARLAELLREDPYLFDRSEGAPS
jgi:hypothetical protein